MEIKLYTRGTVLFRQGDKPKYSFLMLLGVANVYHETNTNTDRLQENISGEKEVPDQKKSTTRTQLEITPRKNSVSAFSKKQDTTAAR
mmetsp:Transcript_38973/g.59254  ORF Transcript_38973/g.59254 Transcript_38973/m.59254 type:complete len:88 (-) Transcript_38973:6235-6498(-)